MTPPTAIISDTHLPRGRRRLPDACLAHLRAAPLILHAGDISTVAALQELRAIGPPVVAVHGNVEEAALIATLPKRTELTIEGVRIGLLHDAGPSAARLRRMRALFPDCAAVVFGHSHIPLYEHQDGFHLFNPGSPTDRRRQPERTMGLLRIGAGGPSFELLPLGP